MSPSGLDRARRVLRQRGVTAVAAGALDEVRATFELRRHRRGGQRSFVVHGVQHTELLHLHNRTWRNERAVEVPLALAFLERQRGPLLELGNVLGNYGRSGHVVVDKYEQQPGVVNVDVVDFDPAGRFGAIVAVSTLEHVGWDEEVREPEKIPRAVRRLRHLLLPQGRILLTCPLSYNPHLDALVASGSLEATCAAFLVREDGRWVQVEQAEAFARARTHRYGATAVWVAELEA